MCCPWPQPLLWNGPPPLWVAPGTGVHPSLCPFHKPIHHPAQAKPQPGSPHRPRATAPLLSLCPCPRRTQCCAHRALPRGTGQQQAELSEWGQGEAAGRGHPGGAPRPPPPLRAALFPARLCQPPPNPWPTHSVCSGSYLCPVTTTASLSLLKSLSVLCTQQLTLRLDLTDAICSEWGLSF